jgi:hypothetical protein
MEGMLAAFYYPYHPFKMFLHSFGFKSQGVFVPTLPLPLFPRIPLRICVLIFSAVKVARDGFEPTTFWL